MSNTDLMNDAELVECAKEMRAVFYQGTHVKWESLVRVEAAAWLRIASFTRDFFRARWKPGPMPTPDFSGDPERVALAKVMFAAANADADWNDPFYKPLQSRLFTYADAAITRLGSGYRLPEATEENAERLRVVHAGMFRYAVNPHDPMHYLRALHAAFGDTAEKPEPQCTATNGDYRCELLAGHGGEHSTERLAWEEPSANDILDSEARINFASEAAERERRRLLEAFMHDMVSNPAVMAKMLENHESDEDAIAARLHQIADALTQEIIG